MEEKKREASRAAMAHRGRGKFLTTFAPAEFERMFEELGVRAKPPAPKHGYTPPPNDEKGVCMDIKEREAVYLGVGEGRAVWVLGELVAYKTTARQTSGAYSLFEVAVPPEGGPPPHVQHQEDESFYVLEGEFELMADGEAVKAGPGSLIYIPKGTLHTYRNIGGGLGRILAVQTPGGLHERFFEEIGEEAVDGTPPAADEPPDIERIAAVAAKYGIEIPPQS